MPATTPVPSTPAAVDTAHAAVVDSAQLIISPHYVTDFGHGVTTPLPSRDQWEEATVMEMPAGAAPTPVPPSPLRSPVVMGLMMLVAMAVVLSYRTGYKYLENFVRNMFSTRRRENLFDDHTVNETKILTALIGLSCVMQGFALMVGVSLAVPSLASGILRSPALSLGLGTAVVLVYYLLQLLVAFVIDRASDTRWDMPSMLWNPVFVAGILALLAYGHFLLLKWLDNKYPSERPVTFNSGYKKITLKKEDILYIESRDSEVWIYTRDGQQYRNRTGISLWEESLGPGFLRVHRSFLVNIADAALTASDVVSVGNQEIPVSRKYKDSVKAVLATSEK